MKVNPFLLNGLLIILSRPEVVENVWVVEIPEIPPLDLSLGEMSWLYQAGGADNVVWGSQVSTNSPPPPTLFPLRSFPWA